MERFRIFRDHANGTYHYDFRLGNGLSFRAEFGERKRFDQESAAKAHLTVMDNDLNDITDYVLRQYFHGKGDRTLNRAGEINDFAHYCRSLGREEIRAAARMASLHGSKMPAA